eukprot:4525324-Amphidinium_carterae.1
MAVWRCCVIGVVVCISLLGAIVVLPVAELRVKVKKRITLTLRHTRISTKRPWKLQRERWQRKTEGVEKKESLCKPRQVSWEALVGRCVLIDTDASGGNTLQEFETYTIFGATRCAWEVWYFNWLHRQRSRNRGVFERLQSVHGLAMRFFRHRAEALGQASDSQQQLNLDLANENATDLASLMLANLNEDDYIIVSVDNTSNGLRETQNLLLTQALVQVGVAQWVDKWLIDTGEHMRDFRVSNRFRSVLLGSLVPATHTGNVAPGPLCTQDYANGSSY